MTIDLANSMQLAIDASRYKIKDPTGVEWYSYHLLNHLIPLLGRDHHTKTKLFLQQDLQFEEELPFNVYKKIIPGKKLWTQGRLSWELLTHQVDKLFVPSHILPLYTPKKTILTVHDLAFMYPELRPAYDFKNYTLLKWSTARAVQKATKLIVPSQATKADLIKFFNCPEKKIEVIYHGGPDLTGDKNPLLLKWSESQKNTHLQRLGIADGDLTMLYVGRIEFKKNLVRVVEAFKRFLQEFPGWKLVLAGKNGQGAEAVLAKVEEVGLQDSVKFTGYVTEDEKNFLLQKCRLLVFPTLCEGFGLPILEAFAFRRPVLTSNLTAMPEIAGKAAYLVNPLKTEEISVGMKRLASDGMLISRLILEGEKQLAKFSWDQCARQTWEVLMD